MTITRASRIREKKINKLYRKLEKGPDERLKHRLRCLQEAEANDILKRGMPPAGLLAQIDRSLKRADELLKKYEKAGE